MEDYVKLLLRLGKKLELDEMLNFNVRRHLYSNNKIVKMNSLVEVLNEFSDLLSEPDVEVIELGTAMSNSETLLNLIKTVWINKKNKITICRWSSLCDEDPLTIAYFENPGDTSECISCLINGDSLELPHILEFFQTNIPHYEFGKKQDVLNEMFNLVTGGSKDGWALLFIEAFFDLEIVTQLMYNHGSAIHLFEPGKQSFLEQECPKLYSLVQELTSEIPEKND